MACGRRRKPKPAAGETGREAALRVLFLHRREAGKMAMAGIYSARMVPVQTRSAVGAFAEDVARAAHRADQIGLTTTDQRLAQTADMHVHGALVDIGVAAPDTVQQLG